MKRSFLVAPLLVVMTIGANAQGLLDPQTALRDGAEALQNGKVYDAIELLSIAERGLPADRQLQVMLGQANLAAGLWVPARRHFETALAFDPNDGLAAFMIGYTLYLSARYPEAEVALERAESLARGNPNPTIYRGLTLLRLGRTQAARRQLELAGPAARDDPAALRGLAEIALTEGNIPRALEHAAAAASRAPGDIETRILLGQIQIRDGRAEEAVADLERLVAQHPNRSDGLYVYSQSLLRSGQREAGLAAVERFREQKATEERIRRLEAAVSRDPTDLDARLDLVAALLDNGQPGTARIHLGPALRQAPGKDRVQALAARVRP